MQKRRAFSRFWGLPQRGYGRIHRTLEGETQRPFFAMVDPQLGHFGFR